MTAARGTIDGVIFGGDGTDKLYAGAGDNEIHGDDGNDTLIGGAGARRSRTAAPEPTACPTSRPAQASPSTCQSPGSTPAMRWAIHISSIEELAGSTSHDNLTGNSSNNWLLGNEGNDVLNGGLGNDRLTGGDGDDTFVFKNTPNASTNIDTISDFDVADDTIQIDNAIFTGLSTGTLASSAFRANTTGNAGDATDRIIYETDTGKLYFDADGNGAGAKIHFATVDVGLALTNADFVVI